MEQGNDGDSPLGALKRASYGTVTVQVAVPWHMRKVPPPLQVGSLGLLKAQSPVTTPLLSVPVTPTVPLVVPVRVPLVMERTLGVVADVTVKVSVPVI